MGRISFAVYTPAIAMSPGENVLPFDVRRRVPGTRSASAVDQRFSGGVVVRLPVANVVGREKAPRAGEGTAATESSGGNEQRFTPFDFVATAFLVLSVFAAPALVWTLLRSVPLG
jgi:hypothetical protein